MDLINHIQKINYKGTKTIPHSYVENYYNDEFNNLNKSKLEFVEIGVRDGSSLKLWASFFPDSNITGIDIITYEMIKKLEKKSSYGSANLKLEEINNINIIEGNACDIEISDLFLDNSIDYIIDDGSHRIEDQLKVIELYWNKIKLGGKIIIEDVGCNEKTDNPSVEECINQIKEKAKLNLYSYKCFDLREIGNHFSVLIELTKIK